VSAGIMLPFFCDTFGIVIMKREFYVVIERDEDGVFIGEVPQLHGCYTKGKTLDELMKNVQEVIHLCLEELPETAGLP